MKFLALKKKLAAITKEDGQVVILVGIMAMFLLILVGIAIDSGLIYMHKRRLQTAAEAGALAGAVALASEDVTNIEVLGSIANYMDMNHVPSNAVGGKYIGIADSGSNYVMDNIMSYGAFYSPYEVVGANLAGVQVETTYEAPLIFANLIGISSAQIKAQAKACAVPGPCTAWDVDPVAINVDIFYDIDGDGTPDVDFENAYILTPGEDIVSITNFPDPDEVKVAPDSFVEGDAAGAVSDGEQTVVIYDVGPITFNGVAGSYHVAGFARVDISGGGRQVEFTRWSRFTEGGCADFGISVTNLNCLNKGRNLAGSISVWKATRQDFTEEKSADVVMVMDVSGSMLEDWGGISRLEAAKSALHTLNDNLRESNDSGEQDHQAALVTFGRNTDLTPGDYEHFKTCLGSATDDTRNLYQGDMISDLTNDLDAIDVAIDSVESRSIWLTPIGPGVLKGTEVALETTSLDHRPVLVVASDGVCNATLDGRIVTRDSDNTSWDSAIDAHNPTKFSNGCNYEAEMDLLEAANIAKSYGMLIYAVSISDPSYAPGDAPGDPTLALVATGEEYFFTPRTPDELETVYESIKVEEASYRVVMENVPNEETSLSGAGVIPDVFVLRNIDTGNRWDLDMGDPDLWNPETGTFQFPNVEPGICELEVEATVGGTTYRGRKTFVIGPGFTTTFVTIKLYATGP